MIEKRETNGKVQLMIFVEIDKIYSLPEIKATILQKTFGLAKRPSKKMRDFKKEGDLLLKKAFEDLNYLEKGILTKESLERTK